MTSAIRCSLLLLLSLAYSVGSITPEPSCDGGGKTCKARPTLSTTSITDLELQATDPDVVKKAAAIYHEHGCVVVRGLNSHFVDPITKSIERTVAQSRRLRTQRKLEKLDEGWVTPDGTLWIPAPSSLRPPRRLRRRRRPFCRPGRAGCNKLPTSEMKIQESSSDMACLFAM